MEKAAIVRITTPLDGKRTRSLRVGDRVLISGTLITARDMASRYLSEKRPERFRSLLNNSAIYHCGPVAIKKREWKILSAGPTTSIRQEPFQPGLIKNYSIRAIIGKGGMGDKTRDACMKHGCVYLHTIGGAASFLAERIVRVKDVFLLKEFGIPEAIWAFEVRDFPAVVTLDSKGDSLHEHILRESSRRLNKIMRDHR